MNNHHTDTAVSRGRAALNRYEAAKASGSPSQIEAARTEMESSRRQLELAKAEKSVLDAMKGAMKTGTTSHSLSKMAQGVRRPGKLPFPVR
jgi:uncharacterized sporulation protein YeaH/YhbH (DUF444 family)